MRLLRAVKLHLTMSPKPKDDTSPHDEVQDLLGHFGYITDAGLSSSPRRVCVQRLTGLWLAEQIRGRQTSLRLRSTTRTVIVDSGLSLTMGLVP